MPEVEYTANPVETLIADVRIARNRLKETPLESFDAVNRELRDQAYPLLIATLEQIAEVDDVIQEVVERQGSYLHQDLASQIFETLAISRAIIDEVKKVVPDLDDMTRKKILDLVDAFDRSAELTVMGVVDAADLDDEDEESVEPAAEAVPIGDSIEEEE